MDEHRRLAMRRKHAGNFVPCPVCGRKCWGNGGYPSHIKAHIRRGEYAPDARERVKFSFTKT